MAYTGATPNPEHLIPCTHCRKTFTPEYSGGVHYGITSHLCLQCANDLATEEVLRQWRAEQADCTEAGETPHLMPLVRAVARMYRIGTDYLHRKVLERGA